MIEHFGEILECRLTKREIKCIILESHGRSIAFSKIDMQPSIGRILVCDLYEQFADIETCDLKVSKFGKWE